MKDLALFKITVSSDAMGGVVGDKWTKYPFPPLGMLSICVPIFRFIWRQVLESFLALSACVCLEVAAREERWGMGDN